MPKLNIYPVPLPDQPGGADTRLELGWRSAPGGAVRIGVTKLQPGADRHQDFFGGTETEPAKPCWDGSFVDLDREQLNQLIRFARDARNKAFGADE